MPVDLEEEAPSPKTKDGESALTDTTTTDTTDVVEEAAPASDPETAGLEEGLKDAEETRTAAGGGKTTAVTTTGGPEAPPEGVKVDDKGRWRNEDGTFANKQPNAEAAKSARDERAQLQRAAEFKAKGLDERGNKPWVPNLYGKERAIIEGAIHRPGVGVLIPESQIGKLTALVARGEKYHEVRGQRQTHAQEIQREQERSEFFSNTFKEILDDTLLNPEWMERATKDADAFETAKMNVQARLRAANVDAKEKFGKIPAKEERASTTGGEPLDPYDARTALDEFLGELAATEEFKGLSKEDTFALLTTDADFAKLPLFKDYGKDGWALDERIARAAAKQSLLRKPADRKATPATDAAARRNTAAVAATPAAPKPPATPARRTVTPTPVDPKHDPKYEGREEYNPALSVEERRELYYKKLGIRVPG